MVVISKGVVNDGAKKSEEGKNQRSRTNRGNGTLAWKMLSAAAGNVLLKTCMKERQNLKGVILELYY